MKLDPARLRNIAWLVCSLPLMWLIYLAFSLNLGANPVETLEHETGAWALIFLLCSLSITPLRKLSGRNEIAPLRRTFGLFAFSYAVLHVLVYVVLDRSLLLSELILDLTKRPYIMLGVAAFLCLFILAVTSPKRMVKKLGAVHWKKIHKLAYVGAPLASAHFIWLKWDKNLLERPLIYTFVLIILLGLRLWWAVRSKPD